MIFGHYQKPVAGGDQPFSTVHAFMGDVGTDSHDQLFTGEIHPQAFFQMFRQSVLFHSKNPEIQAQAQVVT